VTETIIPSTYVDVRAEGLVSSAGPATGVVGIVGTAAGGPVGEAVTLAGLSAARDLFGAPDPYSRPLGLEPLTLIRALELIYANGATSVIAVRVADPSRAAATFAVTNIGGAPVVTLTARHPGTDGNAIRVSVAPAQEPCDIEGEEHTTTFAALRHDRVLVSAANRIRIVRGISRRVDTLKIVYREVVDAERVVPDAAGRYFLSRTPVVTPVASSGVSDVNAITVNTSTVYGDGDILYGSGDPPDAGEVRLDDATGELTFAAGEQPPAGAQVEAAYAVQFREPEAGEVRVSVWDGALDFAAPDAPRTGDGDRLQAWYQVAAASCVAVRLERAGVAEAYTVPDGTVLAQRVNDASSMATARADATRGVDRPAAGIDGYFGTGANTAGANGESAGPDDYRAGLAALADRQADIVVPAGQDAATAGALLLGHLAETEQVDRERIGVLGAPGDAVPDFLGHSIASDRVVLVAPGLRQVDGTALPPAYTAAAVAGLLGAVPVQASLTNKTLALPGLALAVNRGEQAQLIRRDVLAVVDRQGFRVVKGVTTAGEGTPFSAIPTRRIVDHAKYRVRGAANPYLGRLNNDRVRSALKAALDALLTGMVQDEALTSYRLAVSATRAQEIAGEVAVTMTIQPTFSIEYIRVTMILR
jgi:Phage tail sheath C-terminal domain/Phage tail sheath protein subtilisin-like domain